MWSFIDYYWAGFVGGALTIWAVLRLDAWLVAKQEKRWKASRR